MPRKKISKLKMAYLKNVNIDEIIDEHIRYATTSIEEDWNINEGIPGKAPRIVKAVYKKAQPAPRRAVLYQLYQYLIHRIVIACRRDSDGQTFMPVSVYIPILGKHFSDMLRTLKRLGYITVGEYEYTVTSRPITLQNWNIGFKMTNSFKFRELHDKDPYNKNNEHNRTRELTPQEEKQDFFINYQNALAQLQLVHHEQAQQYIEGDNFDSERSRHYYTSIIEDFNINTKTKITIDKNNRIYSYITRKPKKLKKFFNIKFIIDIKNSHPFLLSIFLINHYKIPYSLIKDISLYSQHTIYNHYAGQQLRKTLKNNKINVPNYKKLPTDVIRYIMDVASGQFWDNFAGQFSMNRDETKVNLFREVIYSYSKCIRKSKLYGRAFVQRYPHVWSVIRGLKAGTALPNMMMKHESALFHQILEKCYRRGWVVVNIHDALVVLDVKANEAVTSSDAVRVIENVYNAHGLYPTISVEEYGREVDAPLSHEIFHQK